MIKKDITSREDIQLLIETFYMDLLKVPSIRGFFEHFDMAEHTPRMIDFWAFVLLDEPGYTGNVVEKHLKMPLRPEHFDLWVEHFERTLDHFFSGEKVSIAKERVAVIRWTMVSKLGLI